MRLIFASEASYGHLYPLLPLAVAAQDAGHDVRFATDVSFHPSVRKAGLEPVAAGLAHADAFAQARAGAAPEEGMEFAMRVFGDVMPRRTVVDFAPILEAARPDLVVYELGNVGAALAGKQAGIPTLCHGFGPYFAVPESLIAHLQVFAAELGVELGDVFPFGDHYVDICPPSLQPAEFKATTSRIELRPVPWSEPGDLPAGVLGRDRSRPLVYLTLGTAFGNVDVLRQAIAGLAGLSADVLVATGPAVTVADLGAVPGNVRLETWVAQAELLPHVDLVVHHGGSGTTLSALSAGKPQLYLPQGADQFSNAKRVTGAGAGGRILPSEFSADVVFEQARALLADESVRERSRLFGEEIAGMPSPAEVARRLPELALDTEVV